MKERRIKTLSYYLEYEGTVPEQRESLRRFDAERAAGGRGSNISTRINYAKTMGKLGAAYPKPYKDITKDEVVDFIGGLVTKEGKPMADTTKKLYQICLKRFYRWLYGLPKGQYPDQVSWIEMSRSKATITQSDLVTAEELKKMINGADNSRNRAIVANLWESAFRAAEFLSLKMGSVTEQPYGFDLTAEVSKTEMRTVPITMTAKYLAAWLNDHPARGDPEAPLWCSFGLNTYGKPLTGNKQLNSILKSAARRGGVTRNVHAHLMRHTRLTDMVRHGVRDSYLKGIAGWAKDSQMPSVYTHLSGTEIKEAVLRANGIDIEPPKPTLRAMICERCEYENEPTAIYCSKCGTGLRETPDEVKVTVSEGTLDAIANRIVEQKLGALMAELQAKQAEILELTKKLTGA